MRKTFVLVSFLLAATLLSACYEDPAPPDLSADEALDTTATALDEACYGSCAERAAARYDECRARGNSQARCGQLIYTGWRSCNDQCDQPDSCEETCQARGDVALRACLRRGLSRSRCELRSRRLVAQCTQQVCEERVDIPPCARRCQTRAYKTLRRCLRRGGHPNICGRYAGAHFDTCVQRTCEIPSCDEISCPDGHQCVMDEQGPACVADPEPVRCEQVRCAEGTHCEMLDDGPQCVEDRPTPTCENVDCPERHRCEMQEGQPVCLPNTPTCDDVACPDEHHCEMQDGQTFCVPDRVPSCEERCDRAAGAVYAECVERGEAPDHCRRLAQEHADRCVSDCPRPPETCDNVQCPDEHSCQVVDGAAVCVPERVEPTCGNTHCPDRHHCHETDNGPVCARDHGCEDTICPDGNSCREIEGIAQCFGDEPTCLQLCHRRSQARLYVCVHHERRDEAECLEESSHLRARCADACDRPEPSCDNVVCGDGEVCEIRDGQTACVAEGPNCGNTHCPDRHHCHETGNGPVCARDHGCEDTTCPDGWSCDEIDGIAQCFDNDPTCLQWCYRTREARFYNCVHHDRRDADACAAEADSQRAECANHCG